MTFAPSLDHPALLRGPRSNPRDVDRQPRGIARVRTKIDRPAGAQSDRDDARPLIDWMVKGEELVTGSKMQAYDNVGSAIGKSPSWVRKLLGRQDVALRRFEFTNIVAAYVAVCEKIEAAAAAERLRAEQLRRLAHAPVESAGGPAESLAGASGAGTGGEAPTVLAAGRQTSENECGR